jgi:hypothetical protein
VAVSLKCGNEIFGAVDENECPLLGNDDTYSKIIVP